MPGGIGKAFSVAIAAQFQALGMLALAWFAGNWLNQNYPKKFDWFLVTFLVAIISIAQTFYVMIRHFMKNDSASSGGARASSKESKSNKEQRF